MKNKKIVIICAHLDDEVFGLGGTIAKLSKDNNIHILTIGNKYKKDSHDDKMMRLKCYIDTCYILNVKSTVFSYNDLTFSKNQSKIEKHISDFLEMENPDIIFTHTPKDIHKDHKCISDIVNVINRRKNIEIIHFSIPGNSERNLGNNTFSPNMYIDITEVYKTKKKLLKIYKQYKDYKYPDPLSTKKIKAKDEYYGSLINTKYAEGFEKVK